MTFREKLLYHEVHPAKIIIDVTTALAAAVLLWQQHLLRAAAVGLAPPIIASLWGAALYRSVFYCIVGLLVIALAWVRGALQGSGRIAAEP
jgi:hypothetical protein